MHERSTKCSHGARVATAIAIAICLAAPSTAFAVEPAAPAPAPAATASAEPTSVDMAEVKKIYDEGKAKYDTLDYAGAIEAWTRAYAIVPAQDDYREARNDLAYNIATAQEKAYDIDHKVEHLRQARGLLVSFVEEYKQLYEPTPEAKAEVTRVKDRIAALDARIAAADQTPAIAPKPEQRKRRGAAVKEEFAKDPELYQEYRSGRGMMIGGAVSMGVGGVLGLVGIAVAVNPAFSDGRPVAISLGVIGLAGIVTGAVLLGVGVPKRKRALREAQSRVVVSPTFSRGFAGIGFVGRF